MDGVKNDRAINWLHRLTYGQYENPGEGRTVVLDWVILSQGAVNEAWRHFCCHNFKGEGCYWCLVGRDQKCC